MRFIADEAEAEILKQVQARVTEAQRLVLSDLVNHGTPTQLHARLLAYGFNEQQAYVATCWGFDDRNAVSRSAQG